MVRIREDADAVDTGGYTDLDMFEGINVGKAVRIRFRQAGSFCAFITVVIHSTSDWKTFSSQLDVDVYNSMSSIPPCDVEPPCFSRCT